MRKMLQKTFFLAIALSMVIWSQPSKTAWAGEGVDAAMEFSSAALPAKYGKMQLGWFFYNMYMTEWYAYRADRLTGSAAAKLLKLAGDKEAGARLDQFDKEIAKEKKKKKRRKKEKARDEVIDSGLSSVDSSKSLNSAEKKMLAIALLETATATLMEQRAMRNAKRMIDGIPAARSEATTIGNPLGKARTIKHLARAGKSLPSTVASTKRGLARLAKISKHLHALAKVNKVKAPSEKEVAGAETNYSSEITFED